MPEKPALSKKEQLDMIALIDKMNKTDALFVALILRIQHGISTEDLDAMQLVMVTRVGIALSDILNYAKGRRTD